MKTIFLAESEKHVRDSLRLMIEQRAEVKILGEARSVEGLLAQVCKNAPDAILLDWNLPGIHHQRLINALHECCPTAKLVVLSVKPEHEIAAEEYGMDGFISKQLPAESFMHVLNTILSQVKSNKEDT